MTTEKRKHLAAWFSIIFIFVTLASLFYIVKEENHKCTGEDCPVCACVEGADIFLDYLSDQSKSMSVLYRTQIS